MPHAWRARIEKGRFSRKQRFWHVSTDTCALIARRSHRCYLRTMTRSYSSIITKKNLPREAVVCSSLLPFAVTTMIGAGIVGLNTLSWCVPFSPIYLLLYFHAQNFRNTIKLWFIVNVTLFERGNSPSISCCICLRICLDSLK